MESITMETFQSALGETFRISAEDGPTVDMELIEVTPFGSAAASSSQQQGRQPFSIAFRGPKLPALNQSIYRCENDRLGTIEQLFLVPFNEDEQGRYYEAIFN